MNGLPIGTPKTSKFYNHFIFSVTSLYDIIIIKKLDIDIDILCNTSTADAPFFSPGSCGSHQLHGLDCCIGPFHGGITPKRPRFHGSHGTLGPRVTGAAAFEGGRDWLGEVVGWGVGWLVGVESFFVFFGGELVENWWGWKELIDWLKKWGYWNRLGNRLHRS